jgi:inosine-uridine nucleoside N-ribohydrolase
MKIKYPIRFALAPIAFLMLLTCTAKSSYAESSADATATASIPVIYETDMTLDVDDVGALAVLHGLQKEDKVTLLGVCYNEVHPLGPPVIDAINTYYHRGTIPIGIYKNYRGFFKDSDPSDYFSQERDFDVDNMPHDSFDNIVGDAVAVYKHLLKTQADDSVVIVSVGFLNNLNDLLKDPKGYALVEKKVKRLVVMGALHDDDFNFTRHDLVDQTKYVLENWPGTLVITDVGSRMITGETLTATTPVNNPVRRAYELEWEQGPNVGRSSWDQVAVLYAVYGTQYYKEDWDGNGRLRDDEGKPKFTWSLKKGHRGYAAPKNDAQVEQEIERLMTLAP